VDQLLKEDSAALTEEAALSKREAEEEDLIIKEDQIKPVAKNNVVGTLKSS